MEWDGHFRGNEEGGEAASGTVRAGRNDACIGGGAASTSTCGATFAAFTSYGSSKVVGLDLALIPHREFSLLLLLESAGAFVSN